jgi:lipoprotein signal peptidase
VDAFFLPCFAHDLQTRRSIHPAYLIALALVVLDQVLQVTVVTWTPWIDFSNALQRLVA